MAQNLGDQIDADVAGNKVVVYSKSWCPFCVQTKDLLASKNVQYKLVELDQLPNGDAIQSALQGKTGQRTVPSVFIGGAHIGGNSELQALNGSGGLDAKLAA
eukprot:Macronucleus_9527.p1 GENE.Macronucleus_9527~~Macronucleus_9527.p1  ORF type:complete len:102 (+),score=37.67 Macronucleus_9527:1-306(+)